MEQFDLIVVGAGPAGSTLAIRLARAGMKILLVDKEKFPRDKVCGEFVNPLGVRLLDELGLLPAIKKTEPQKMEGQILHGGDGSTVKGSYGDTPGFVLRRTVLDHLLLRAAAKEKNVRILEDCRVVDLRESQRDKIYINAVIANKNKFEASTAWLAGADGVKSFIAKKGGFSKGRWGGNKLALASHFDGVAHSNCGEMFLAPFGYAGLAPLGPRKVGISIVFENARKENFCGSPEKIFWKALAQLPELNERLKRGERTGDVLSTGWIPHYRNQVAKGKIFLVGDAAYFIDPFTGEGMTQGLLAARLAAKVFAQAGSLRQYQIQFHKTFFATALRGRALQAVLPRKRLMNFALRHIGKRAALSDWLIGRFGGVKKAAKERKWLVEELAR